MIQFKADAIHFQERSETFYEPQVFCQFHNGNAYWCRATSYNCDSLESAHRAIEKYLETPPFSLGHRKALGTRVLMYKCIITEKQIVESTGDIHG